MEKDIVIEGLQIHYDDSGKPDGDPVILMHGWGCNHSTVKSISAILEQGMRVINLDLPGHGQSSEPPEVWGVEEFTRLIEKLIDKLELKRVSLIGHSFGGRISLLLSSRNNIEKMVLVDAAGIKPQRSVKKLCKIYGFKAFKHLVHVILGRKKGDKLIEKYRRKVGSPDYRNSSPMMRAVMSKCINEDLKYVMPSIKAPTLLIWGEDDSATPLRDAKIMEKLIPDAGLVSFPGCGHYSFLDNPWAFKKVMQEFFKGQLKK